MAQARVGSDRPAEYGVILGLLPGERGFDVRLQRAPDSAGSPGTYADVAFFPAAHLSDRVTEYIDLTGPGTYWYRARHERLGWTDGAWATAVAAAAVDLAHQSGGGAIYPLYRTKAWDDGFFAAAADSNVGTNLVENVRQTDGVSAHTLVKGRQRVEVRHGDSITFTPVFQHIPSWRVAGRALTYQPASVWGTRAQVDAGTGTTAPLAVAQEEYVTLEGLSASGVDTVVALLKQRNSALTARSDSFTAGALTSTTGTIECNLPTAPAYDDRYTVAWAVDASLEVTGTKATSSAQLDLVVAVESNDGSGWVRRGTRGYTLVASGVGATADNVWSESVTYTVPGLGANDDWRLLIATLTVTGEGDAFVSVDPDAVTYATGTNTDQYASMTPNTDQFLVLEFEDAA